MSRKRFKADVRKDQIITVALRLAAEGHYIQVTREQIARELGVTGPAIQHHFSTMDQLRNEVIRAARKREDLVVLAQGIVSNNQHALAADDALRSRALDLYTVG